MIRASAIRISRPGLMLGGSGFFWIVMLAFFGGIKCGAANLYQSDPEYLIRTWDVEDGLPDTSATSMVQTEDGYLWIGTFDGLVRFNGTDFLTVNSASATGFPGNGVVNLHLDKTRRLWVSTLEGLGVRENGTWRVLDGKEGWTGGYVRTFAERANGDLLFTTFEGTLAEFSNGQFRNLPVPGEQGRGHFGYADSGGRWWAVQHGFIGWWNGGTWTAAMPPPLTKPSGIVAVGAEDGGMWLLEGNLLLKLSGGLEVKRTVLPDASDDYWGLMEDHLGQVWVCTSGTGLLRISPDGRVRRWTTANGLAAQSLRFTFEDREKNIWVGTNGGGLQRFSPKRLRSFTPNNAGRPNFSSVSARKAGGVWLASYGQGLFRLDGDGLQSMSPPGESLPAAVQSVLEDTAGRVWIGSYGGGFHVMENGVLHHVTADKTGGGNGISLFEDSTGRIWMSGGQGIAVYEHGRFRIVGEEAGVPPGSAACFAEGRDGSLWIAHDRGVYVRTSDRFEMLMDGSGHPLLGITRLCAEHGTGVMWMCDKAGDLIRWRGGRLDRVNNQAGLPAVEMSGLTDDACGHLWISSRHGLTRLDWRELNAVADHTLPRAHGVLLDTSDGLPGLEFSGNRQPLSAMDGEGKLWFPLLRGAAVIDPAKFTPDPEPPRIYVEEVTFLPLGPDHQTAREARVTAIGPEGVVVPAGSRRLTLKYAALGFGAPEKIRYQVKLEGHDAGWQDMQNQNEVVFYELPAGDYVFRARAANRDGVWNESGVSMRLKVQAYYWETSWFRASASGLLVMLGAAVTWRMSRQRHRRMEERLEAEQQRSELAHLSRVITLSELSGSLAHELNQPLTIILSNAQAAQRILTWEDPDLPEVRNILADIVSADKRAGQVIQRLRALLKRGECRFAPEDLNLLVEEVLSLARQDLMNRGISVQCDFSPLMRPVNADRVQLQQVVLNLITNACDSMASNKADDRHLQLATSVVNGKAHLVVEDDGCGLPPGDPENLFNAFVTTKKHGLGLGLSISRSIVHAHHGALRAERRNNRGTTLILTLPVVSRA